jgi:hypothetical protein
MGKGHEAGDHKRRFSQARDADTAGGFRGKRRCSSTSGADDSDDDPGGKGGSEGFQRVSAEWEYHPDDNFVDASGVTRHLYRRIHPGTRLRPDDRVQAHRAKRIRRTRPVPGHQDEIELNYDDEEEERSQVGDGSWRLSLRHLRPDRPSPVRGSVSIGAHLTNSPTDEYEESVVHRRQAIRDLLRPTKSCTDVLGLWNPVSLRRRSSMAVAVQRPPPAYAKETDVVMDEKRARFGRCRLLFVEHRTEFLPYLVSAGSVVHPLASPLRTTPTPRQVAPAPHPIFTQRDPQGFVIPPPVEHLMMIQMAGGGLPVSRRALPPLRRPLNTAAAVSLNLFPETGPQRPNFPVGDEWSSWNRFRGERLLKQRREAKILTAQSGKRKSRLPKSP